ncbi:MAG: hypothetical protein AAFX56_15375 [Pseudomonadota bacterium]
MPFLTDEIEHELTDEVKAWLKEEIKEQDERYEKIAAEMQAIDTSRDQWYEEFFERLKKYGFNQDGDTRVKIPDEELPVKPDREHKVVY